MYKFLRKSLILLLVTVLTASNLVVLGNNSISYAQESTQTQGQTTVTASTSTQTQEQTTVTASTQGTAENQNRSHSIAELQLNRTELTTVVKNENVEIRAILDTSNKDHALYKNPTLKIVLPSYIESVNLKNYDILMGNGLSIKSANVQEENGSKVIKAVLEGTQTEHTIDAAYRGTIIIFNTDLTVNKLTPDNKSKVVMKYTNENTKNITSEESVSADIKFVAPNGLITTNAISQYAEGKAEVFTITESKVKGEVAVKAQKRNSNVKGLIINNYDNSLQDLVILGRIPAKDNKKTNSDENLGSTFSTTLTTQVGLNGIDSSKYTIYYSDKADATKDISDANNGWTTQATNQSKSYLVVTNGYEMNKGSKIELSYGIEIPENLEYKNSSSEMYQVYYNNVSSVGTMAETKVSPVVELTTGQGPELTAELSSTVDTIREGQIVKMNLVIKNTGSVAATNVKVTVPLPECAKFVKYNTGTGFAEENITSKEISIDKINAAGKYECSYCIQINSSINENLPKTIINKVNITLNELTETIYSNEVQYNIEAGYMLLEMLSDRNQEEAILNSTKIECTLSLKKLSKVYELKNVVVYIPLPNGAKYCQASFRNEKDTSIKDEINYNEESNTIIVNIESLTEQEIVNFELDLQNCGENIDIYASAETGGVKKQYSNVIQHIIKKSKIEVSELISTPKYVKEGNNITYKLTIKNIGDMPAMDITISDLLPEGLAIREISCLKNKTTEVISTNNGSNNNIQNMVLGILDSGESYDITIIAKANLLPDQNDKEIQNYMIVSAKGINEVNTNTVVNVIEYNEEAHQKDEEEVDDPEQPDPEQPDNPDPDNPDPDNPKPDNPDPDNPDNPNPDNPDNPTPDEPKSNRYKITGTAWIDSNKDGKRASSEEILQNVTVILLNKADNTIVKDAESKEEKRVTTGSDGKYEFTNLPQGEYIVVFLYDATKYTLTTYRAKGVDEYSNSDAISINITVDGNRTIAGITDVINITNENVRDIDIGVYTSEKFDLSLEKYVSRIALTTPTIGTRTDEHNNSKTAKVEVLGSNVGKSSIVIEYKIVVKNEGEVAGYAKKVVDYLPAGVGFSTELNKDWYLSDNGNVYNASLANEIINPGETKELTLVLTKKITEDSLGVLTNNAEIYEAYNEQGLKDIDSTPGNKAENEDDMSKADIAISIVTGKIITYTAIAFGVMVILGFGVYEIKTRVLKKKRRNR